MHALISLICPSRSRPQRFAAMLASALEHADHPAQIEVQLLLDNDDPLASDYPVHPHVELTVAQRRLSVPAAMDFLAMQRSHGGIVMAASDDILFRTPGWDSRVRRRFEQAPGGLLLAYTNDGRDRDKCEHFFVSRRWLEVVGRFMPRDLEHFGADEFVERIARAAGCAVFLKDVVTEHMHFKYGKAEKDESYAAKRTHDEHGRSVSDRDRVRIATMAGEITAAADRVRAARAQYAADRVHA